MKLCLLEDDELIGKNIKKFFELESFLIDWFKNCQSLSPIIQDKEKITKYDIFILDWNLPDGNGLTVCQTIRKHHPQVPIIFLTANQSEDYVIRALTEGANDFMRKPFSSKELLARAKKQLSVSLVLEEIYRFHDLVVNCTQKKIFWQDQELGLKPKEFEIVLLLTRQAPSIVSREKILSFIDKDLKMNDRTIDSHVSHIRQKLKQMKIDHLKIVSVYGDGYRLECISKTDKIDKNEF